MIEGKYEPTGIIIRDKHDPSKQLQLHIDHEKGSVGIVYSKGMEMIVISTNVNKDIPIQLKEENDK